MALKFVSNLDEGDKRMALYLMDHHPQLWRTIHRELATVIAPGAEVTTMRAGAKICAHVGRLLWQELARIQTRGVKR